MTSDLIRFPLESQVQPEFGILETIVFYYWIIYNSVHMPQWYCHRFYGLSIRSVMLNQDDSLNKNRMCEVVQCLSWQLSYL